MWKDNISKNNFEQCLKCDICSTVCPMMEVNPDYPGPKQAGPDGERYRLKDPAFYDMTLRFCLDCKRCEVACPSGVNVGDIIQSARIAYGRKTHPLRDALLSDTDFVGSLASHAAGPVNSALRKPAVRAALHSFGIDRHVNCPEYRKEKFVDWFGTYRQPVSGDRAVSFFHGCYVNYNNPELGKNLVRLMNACGYKLRLLDREKCCGAAFLSNGFTSKATRNAGLNAASIRKTLSEGAESVITTSTACTYTIRDEYGNLLGIPMDDVRQDVMLATRWLYKKIEDGSIRLAFKPASPRNLAYHTSCHMKKLGWAVYSVDLLKMIPGINLTILDQDCCGIAGTFGFKKENYGYSQKIGAKLFARIEESGADAVVTDCETCKWQIEMSTGYKVLNPVELLYEALDLEKTYELNR